jgi:ribonuclease HI
VCKNAIGGYATVLTSDKTAKLIQNRYEGITNQRAALLGVLEGLAVLKFPCKVTVKTDSLYAVSGINKYLANWKQNEWKRSNGQPVANVDLWKAISGLCEIHDVKAVKQSPHPRLIELAEQALSVTA